MTRKGDILIALNRLLAESVAYRAAIHNQVGDCIFEVEEFKYLREAETEATKLLEGMCK